MMLAMQVDLKNMRTENLCAYNNPSLSHMEEDRWDAKKLTKERKRRGKNHQSGLMFYRHRVARKFHVSLRVSLMYRRSGKTNASRDTALWLINVLKGAPVPVAGHAGRNLRTLRQTERCSGLSSNG